MLAALRNLSRLCAPLAFAPSLLTVMRGVAGLAFPVSRASCLFIRPRPCQRRSEGMLDCMLDKSVSGGEDRWIAALVAADVAIAV